MPKRNRHRELVHAGLAPSPFIPSAPLLPQSTGSQFWLGEVVTATILARVHGGSLGGGKLRPAVYVGESATTGSHLVAGLTTLAFYKDGSARTAYTGWERYGLRWGGYFWGGRLIWVDHDSVTPLHPERGDRPLLTPKDWHLFCTIHGEELAALFGPDYETRGIW